MPKNDQQFNFQAYCLSGIVLDAIKRNGLEATLQDLRKNCRHHPKSDEVTYRDFLDVVNGVSERVEGVIKRK